MDGRDITEEVYGGGEEAQSNDAAESATFATVAGSSSNQRTLPARETRMNALYAAQSLQPKTAEELIANAKTIHAFIEFGE
jgi:hypothetical protein